MYATDPKSKFVLSAIRGYVRLLVVAIVILSCILLGYLSWHNNLHRNLEEFANHYHLETILYCAQIKEEIIRISLAYEDGRIDTQHSDRQGLLRSDYTNSVYLLEMHVQTINQLDGAYGADSGKAAGFEPIIHKMNRQFARIKALLEESGVISLSSFIKSEASLLSSFTHSIEQLSRMHAIAWEGSTVN